MPDGTILQNRGMGVRQGSDWQEIDGGAGVSRRASSYPEGEQLTQHQLCVGVNQVGLLVLFLSFNPKDKQSESVKTKAPYGAKLLI